MPLGSFSAESSKTSYSSGTPENNEYHSHSKGLWGGGGVAEGKGVMGTGHSLDHGNINPAMTQLETWSTINT